MSDSKIKAFLRLGYLANVIVIVGTGLLLWHFWKHPVEIPSWFRFICLIALTIHSGSHFYFLGNHQAYLIHLSNSLEEVQMIKNRITLARSILVGMPLFTWLLTVNAYNTVFNLLLVLAGYLVGEKIAQLLIPSPNFHQSGKQ